MRRKKEKQNDCTLKIIKFILKLLSIRAPSYKRLTIL